MALSFSPLLALFPMSIHTTQPIPVVSTPACHSHRPSLPAPAALLQGAWRAGCPACGNSVPPASAALRCRHAPPPPPADDRASCAAPPRLFMAHGAALRRCSCAHHEPRRSQPPAGTLDRAAGMYSPLHFLWVHILGSEAAPAGPVSVLETPIPQTCVDNEGSRYW